MITFTSVSKSYEGQQVLRDVSFSLAKGEMAFITGPTGAGKTTLLRLIYMAERPDSGDIVVDERQLSSLRPSQIPLHRRNIGVVFQDFRLLDNLTVFDNVALALRIRGIGERDVQLLVTEALKSVHLRHKTDGYPRTLSGGEQQRVVIARAIVASPPVVLADEPTGNLDADTAQHIMRIFLELHVKGTTIFIATHNRDLFRYSGNRVMRIENGTLTGEEKE